MNIIMYLIIKVDKLYIMTTNLDYFCKFFFRIPFSYTSKIQELNNHIRFQINIRRDLVHLYV